MISDRKMQHSTSGFTLVELAIVLVIIGLIVASVLVGQDLVRQAELRATVTQYEQYQAAVGTFRSKYNGLPGDVSNTTLGFANAGDGDGVLESGSGTSHNGELVYFWNHLGATGGSQGAGLIKGSYAGAAVSTTDINSQTPKTSAGNNWGVFAASSINYYIIGATIAGANNDFSTADTLTPLEAFNIDSKIDDSRPGRGVVQARDGNATVPNTAPDAAGADACVSAATAAGNYSTSITVQSCTLRIRM